MIVVRVLCPVIAIRVPGPVLPRRFIYIEHFTEYLTVPSGGALMRRSGKRELGVEGY